MTIDLPVTIPALAVRQPWAWAIFNASKGVENRERKDGAQPDVTRHRGPLLILASASVGVAEFDGAVDGIVDVVNRGDDFQVTSRSAWLEPCATMIVPRRGIPLPLWRPAPALAFGGIVGITRALGYVDPHGHGCEGSLHPDARLAAMRWHVPGSWGLVLADQTALPFSPAKGALGIFQIETASLLPETREALAAWWA